MFKKFQPVALFTGYATLILLAILGLMSLLGSSPVLALSLNPQPASAQLITVPQILNYQGTLRDSAGVLVTGARDMTLKLYAEVIGGTALWTETHTGVVVRDGVFDVVLGDITPLTSDLFHANAQLYLGVTVGAFEEMIPRQRLYSVPYAAQAVQAAQAELPPAMPPGSVMAFAGATAPDGWLLCDGSAISRANYPELFAAIGAAHGSGDGSITFNLPDYRGRFLRGVDAGAGGLDPDNASRTAMNMGGNTGNAVGSVQADDFKTHTHSYSVRQAIYGISAIAGGLNLWQDVGNTSTGAPSNIVNGAETRPENAYVNWIIKY